MYVWFIIDLPIWCDFDYVVCEFVCSVFMVYLLGWLAVSASDYVVWLACSGYCVYCFGLFEELFAFAVYMDDCLLCECELY